MTVIKNVCVPTTGIHGGRVCSSGSSLAFWEFPPDSRIDITEPPSEEVTSGADCLWGLPQAQGAGHAG